MPTTQLQPEYKILMYLNRETENFDVKLKDIRDNTGLTLDQIKETLSSLIEKGYVGTKTEREKGYTLTRDGHVRINQLAEHIETLKNFNALKQKADETKNKVDKIAVYGFVVAVVALLFSFLQILYAYLQYSAAIDQLEIQVQQMKQESESYKPAISAAQITTVHDTVYLPDSLLKLKKR